MMETVDCLEGIGFRLFGSEVDPVRSTDTDRPKERRYPDIATLGFVRAAAEAYRKLPER